MLPRQFRRVGQGAPALCAALLLAFALACPQRAFSEDARTLRLNEAGLVEPAREDPTILLDIRYATANNFTKQKVYPSARCFLRADISRRLLKVQALLRKQGLGLKLYDCYRPFSVQEAFWRIMPDERYVGKPVRENGVIVKSSRHNRGAAVDVTLVDANGRELPMPTGFDDFTSAAHRASAKPGSVAARNSALLERVMTSQGFEPLSTEWWHFDGPGSEDYSPLDLPLPADN
ncbi:MAG: hypothetical protein AUJ49_08050 [Desulfovibrionaceae bacterium CG1_02_65_16]|nr:MAG: hypothetical protein AUJ49_08050 [Desulfovibrionaceae bacterium CG1_02_65_16]